MIEYTGDLPKHVIAQIQEHTTGGFLMFRIGKEGEVTTDFIFDDETCYNSLVRKATIAVTALNAIDNSQAIRAFSFGMGGFDNDEEFDEDDEGLNDEDDSDDDDYEPQT